MSITAVERPAPPLWRRLIQRIPTPVSALVLQLLAFAASLFTPDQLVWLIPAALFFPGPIQRLNWRHALLAGLFACVAIGTERFEDYFELHRLLSLFTYWLHAFTTIAFVGVSEWVLRPGRNRYSLACVMTSCAASAAIQAVVYASLRFVHRQVRIPLSEHSRSEYSLADLVRYPLMAVLTWIAIEVAYRVASSPRRVAMWRLVACSACALGLCALFFTHSVYILAAPSLQGYGPFSRDMAAMLLAYRGTDADFEALAKALESADWKPERDAFKPDYRVICVEKLAEHDSAATARLLAQLLEEHPTGFLATQAAPLIAEHRLYESVPMLLRYAFQSNTESLDALTKLRVPQAATPLICLTILQSDVEESMREPVPKPGGWINSQLPPLKPFEPSVLAILIELLGPFEGKTGDEWLDRYDEVIAVVPTPLSPELASQANRVVDAMTAYKIALDDEMIARKVRISRLYIAKVRAAGLGHVAQKMEEIARQTRDEGRAQVPYISALDVELIAPLLDEVRRDNPRIKVDLNVPTVAGLEREILRYEEKVHTQYADELRDEPSPPAAEPSPGLCPGV